MIFINKSGFITHSFVGKYNEHNYSNSFISHTASHLGHLTGTKPCTLQASSWTNQTFVCSRLMCHETSKRDQQSRHSL